MSTLSNRVAAALIWVCVVTAGALLVWLVVSRVGAGLVGGSGIVPTGTAPTPTAEPSPSSTGEPPRQGSWQSEAGIITAACTGAHITLVGAQPEEGVVDVVQRGPKRLVVAFRGEAGSATTIAGRCIDGRPHFSVIRATTDQRDADNAGLEVD
jgi:hypothetical protein